MKKTFFIVLTLILIVPMARFSFARDVEANCNVSADKLPHGYDLKKITMEELKGAWCCHSIGGVDVNDIDFYLLFTGNNIVLWGSSDNRNTTINNSLAADFYYLSDTVDETFNVGKLQNNRGRYIIISDNKDVMGVPAKCIMVSKNSNGDDTLVAYFKTRFPENYITIELIKKDILYPPMVVPFFYSGTIDSAGIICADNTGFLGQWQVSDVVGATVDFTDKGYIVYSQKTGSANDSIRKQYNSFYYLSDSPDSHFDMNKMLSDKGKYIIVKNVFYYNEHYNNDTFIFPINKIGSDTAVISCPLNNMGKLILKRE